MEIKVPPKVYKEMDPEDPEGWYDSLGYCRYPPMDKEANELYEKMKGTNQDSVLQEMKEQTDMMKGGSRYRRDKQSLEALIFYMTDTQGMSYQDVADITGMPYNTVKGMAWRHRNREESA